MKTLQGTELSETTKQVIFDGLYICDLAHEEAEYDERVIYYHSAKEYVNNYDDVDELEDEWKDLGFEFEDLNTLYTQLAFIGVKNELLHEFADELKEDLDELKEIESMNQVELDCVEYDQYELIKWMKKTQLEIEDAIKKIEEQI